MKNKTFVLGTALMVLGVLPLCAGARAICDRSTFKEDPSQWNTYEEGMHTTYIGHEFYNTVGHMPSIGHRYQKDEITADISTGYKYLAVGSRGAHCGTANVNVFYSFHQSPRSQTYAGMGLSFEIMRNKLFLEKSDKCAISPAITIGRDLMFLKTKKIFWEVIYKPYSYGKYYKGKSHVTSFRVGVGF